MTTGPTTIFFDRSRDPAAFAALRDALQAGRTARVGILCNLPAGSPEMLRAGLAAAGLAGHVDPSLIVVADGLGCPLPDPRAFAAAAAVAGVPPAACVFVSDDPAALVGAAEAGFRTVTLPVPRRERAVPVAETAARRVAPFEGEVDPDAGSAFVLRGRIVTMRAKGEVFDDGYVAVSKGLIRAVAGNPGDPLPDGFDDVPVIDTRGTIYPGLIDLHNHFVYDVLPLWVVPRKYANRSQWPSHREYVSNVSKPIKEALAKYFYSAAAVVRYVEAKALIGGTTTGQGILTQTKAGKRAIRGAMRNVEETDDPRLPEAATQVPDLGTSAERIAKFRQTLATHAAFFYHLAEGTDAAAHRHFENLQSHGLVAESLVGIHALALTPDDLAAMAANKAKVVWSPFSNLLLYGETLDLKELKKRGVRFAIGCDWSPTGSRNLLQELKVAAFENARQGGPYSAFDLARAVTAEAAATVAWQGHVGVLEKGKMADLLVLEGKAGDPYERLIGATERDVRLVTVHGVARYGDRALMGKVHDGPAADLEEAEIGGGPKAFFLRSDEPLLNDLTFSAAVDRLTEAMADLPAFVDRMEREEAGLLAFGVDEPQPLTLVPDNEFEANDPLTDFPATAGFFEDDVPMARRIELDAVAVAGDDGYIARVAEQNNLPAGLAAHLEHAYAS